MEIPNLKIFLLKIWAPWSGAWWMALTPEQTPESVWRIQLSKLGVPPPQTPPCRARTLYNRWASKVRKRNRLRNSSTLGVIGIVVNMYVRTPSLRSGRKSGDRSQTVSQCLSCIILRRELTSLLLSKGYVLSNPRKYTNPLPIDKQAGRKAGRQTDYRTDPFNCLAS